MLKSFHQLRPPAQRGLFALAGLAAMMAIAAVIIGVSQVRNGSAAAEPVARATALATSTVVQPSTVASASIDARPEVLTPKSSPQLAALLKAPNAQGNRVVKFAKDHAGETIKFTGYVSNVQLHGTYKTRYDVLICPTRKCSVGPYFQFNDVNLSDLHLQGIEQAEALTVGDALRIKAEVGDLSEMTGLFRLLPVSTTLR